MNLRLRFLVRSVLVAELAELLHLELAGLVLLILGKRIIPPFTFLACQQYDIAHMLL